MFVTHLCTRIYASIALQRGRSPVFLSWGAKESVLQPKPFSSIHISGINIQYHFILHCCRPRLPPIFWLTTPQKMSLSMSLPWLNVMSVTILVSSSSSSLDQVPGKTKRFVINEHDVTSVFYAPVRRTSRSCKWFRYRSRQSAAVRWTISLIFSHCCPRSCTD